MEKSRLNKFRKVGDMYEMIENQMSVTKRAWKYCGKREIERGSFVKLAELYDILLVEKEERFGNRDTKRSKYPYQVVDLCNEINMTTKNRVVGMKFN